VCDGGGYSGTLCSKFAAVRQIEMFHDNQVNFASLVP
jgi:hypothetical protein